jgi:hypothetical protein
MTRAMSRISILLSLQISFISPFSASRVRALHSIPCIRGTRSPSLIVQTSPFLPSHHYGQIQRCRSLGAKPKQGNVVESYQTVSVNCAKCRERLFRYKKKNGTKSNLIKCFVERIAEDSANVLKDQGEDADTFTCPSCETQFARAAMIKGLPALKLVGGKTRMTKK